jgi:hypothetical protein
MNTSKTDMDVSKTAAKCDRQDSSREEALRLLKVRKWVQRGPGDAWRLSSDLSARLGVAPDRRSVRVPVSSFEVRIWGG